MLKASDYTHKSQRLAEFAREVEHARATVAELVPILTPMLEQQIRTLEGNLGEEPNWIDLARTDPAQYNIKRADWDMAERERKNLAALRNTQNQQTEVQQRVKLAEGHKQLSTALPGWTDPAQRARIQSEIIKYGKANGFPDPELKNIYEPRHIIALTKAMMFDRLMANAKTDAPVLPVVRRGGVPPQTTDAIRQAEQAFGEKPSARNAAMLLSAQRRQNGRVNGRG